MLIDAQNTSIDSREVVRYFSGSNRTRISQSLRSKVDKFNDNVIPNLDSKISYEAYKIASVSNGWSTLGNGVCFSSAKLAKTMAHCSEVVCFLATIGPILDTEISILTAQGRLSSVSVLDAMGSMLVENLVQGFQKKTTRTLNTQDRETTVRFSPGYCDWPITQQKVLFRLLDAQALGVKLSQSCLMSPRKTISGVFGIYHRDELSEPYIPCRDCGKKDCSARRAELKKSTQARNTAYPT